MISKRKFVSLNQCEDSRSMLAGIQSKMSKLVSMLQDVIVPTKKKRAAALNMVAAESAKIENQFLIHSTEEQLLSLSPEDNPVSHENDGNLFATTQTGNQLPTLQTSADILTEDLLAKNSPLSFPNETTECQCVVPNFNNGIPNISLPTARYERFLKVEHYQPMFTDSFWE